MDLRPILIAIGDGKKNGPKSPYNDVIAGKYDPYTGYCEQGKWDGLANVTAWTYFPEHPGVTRMKKIVKDSKKKSA